MNQYQIVFTDGREDEYIDAYYYESLGNHKYKFVTVTGDVVRTHVLYVDCLEEATA